MSCITGLIEAVTESAPDVVSSSVVESSGQVVAESLGGGFEAGWPGYEVVDSGMTATQYDDLYGISGTTDISSADALYLDELQAQVIDLQATQADLIASLPGGDALGDVQLPPLSETAQLAKDVADLKLVAESATSLTEQAINNFSTTVSNFVTQQLPKLATDFAKNQLIATAKSVVTSTLGNTPAGRAAAAALNKGIDKTAAAVTTSSTSWGVFGTSTSTFSVTDAPAAAAIPTLPPYDETGTLNLGWTLNEFDQPVFIGGGFVDSTGKFLTPPPNAVNPATASIFGLTLNDAYDAATGALKEGWQIISGKAINVAEALAGGLTVLKAVDGTPYLADKDGVPVTSGTFLNAAATALLPQFGGTGLATIAASNTAVGIALAQKQATLAAQRLSNATTGDWRVRLSLAPNAGYLYNAAAAGTILAPLRNTDGVIFPYTPTIQTSYKAEYTSYDLTHSNFRGYFYKNSSVEPIEIRGTFTAQDTAEANYLLAVIHFFRSVTKMFYGQDANRGAPPPLVYLSGLGQYQFNKHPCVVSSFVYTLPAEVNYIRSSAAFDTNGTNILTQRESTSSPSNALSYTINRLYSLGQGIDPGAQKLRPPSQQLGQDTPSTYVPTKMDITITLLPMQSRKDVSQLFSVAEFANGNLLKGGFW